MPVIHADCPSCVCNPEQNALLAALDKARSDNIRRLQGEIEEICAKLAASRTEGGASDLVDPHVNVTVHPCTSCQCYAHDAGAITLKPRNERSRSLQNLLSMREHRCHSILALLYDHNASRPINCMPVELLQHIFTWQIKTIYDFDWELLWPDPRWPITLTQVCRLWRQISMNSPVLWMCLTLDSTKPGPPLTLAMRERFPRHPLRIFCPHDNQNHTDLSDIVAQNRMRIAGLWIDADTDAGILSALDAFQGCAPELHTLYIQLSAWISPAKTAAIEARLAELSAPLIQYLRVDSAATRCLWNSQIIRASNLRHLSICGFEEVPDSESDDSGSAQSEDKPDLREVLDVLVHLESLEVLCLVYCSPPTHQLFVAERRPCPRSLQELVVWGSACDSINILQNLELTQPLGRVVLCNTVCGDCVDFTLALLQLVEKRCVLPRDVTLEAEQPEEEKWNIELALEFGRSPSTPTSVGWSFPVGISFQTEDEAEAPLVLQDIIQMLRTSRITSLALKGQLNSPNAFRNSRGELPGNWPSQEISVGCSWAFISLMKSFLRATSILSRYSAVLPNVTSLEFADIDFLMRPRSRTGQPWFEVLRSGVEWLWRRRSEDGRPILRRVMFRRCTGFSEEDLEVLRSMVPGVHVLTMNDLTPPVTIPPGNDSE